MYITYIYVHTHNTHIYNYTHSYNTYVYTYMYICICISVYVYMYLCIYVYLYICIYVYLYICIYVYMYICIYVCIIYIYVYICMYNIYIYILYMHATCIQIIQTQRLQKDTSRYIPVAVPGQDSDRLGQGLSSHGKAAWFALWRHWNDGNWIGRNHSQNRIVSVIFRLVN